MKVALIAPDDFTLAHFAKGLIAALNGLGVKVYGVSAHGLHASQLEASGAIHIPVSMARFISPIQDLRALFAIYRICRKNQFDLVHTLCTKANIVGAIGARLAGVKKIVTSVMGLGFTFGDDPGRKVRSLKPLVTGLYRLACSCADRVSFENGEDRELFISLGIVPSKKSLVIPGCGVSGVNVDEYSPRSVTARTVARVRNELDADGDRVLVLMVVARAVWSKGVREFVTAAELLRDRCPSAEFRLVGAIERDSPDSVPESYLKEKETAAHFRWMPFRRDIRDVIGAADFVVLPSYYREGLPRVLLEAMSLAKPIVTTDNVGCRETVEDGKNGFIVPVKNPVALADAIEKLVKCDPRAIERFGKYSRIKAEREYDEKTVVQRTLCELYGRLATQAGNAHACAPGPD